MAPISHFTFLVVSLLGSFLSSTVSLPTGVPLLDPRQAYTATGNTSQGDQTFDYVIVGGGTAGLTLASRLAEEPSIRVAVIEAGGFYESDTGNKSEIPFNCYLYNGKSPKDTNPLMDWDFVTTPQAVVHYARGKTLGGSSALNYMSYIRPPKGLFEQWVNATGDASWAYDSVAWYYRKSLNFTPPDATTRLANATPQYNAFESGLGNDGPLPLSYPRFSTSWSTWIPQAMAEVGIPRTNSYTDGQINGSAWILTTIDQETGKRASSEAAFLRPYLSRPNLVVFTRTMAEKVIFDGTRATGVAVSSSDGNVTLRASNEVIVSAGAFQSPQLLMVSGVGPAVVLEKYNIPVVANRPGVGEGMMDHVLYGVSYRVKLETYSALSYNATKMQQAVDDWNERQQGPLTQPGGDLFAGEKLNTTVQTGLSPATRAYLGTLPADFPDMLLITRPAALGNVLISGEGGPTDGYQYASLLTCLTTPEARGRVSINSSSIHDPPLIDPNWLGTPGDQEIAVAAFKRIRQVFAAPSLQQDALYGEEYFPGANVTTDAEILQAIKDMINTMYHAGSTNKMGRDGDPMAVLDGRARVLGVERLRVVDVSSLPSLPPNLPQASVYMIAERIADDIKDTSEYKKRSLVQ